MNSPGTIIIAIIVLLIVIVCFIYMFIDRRVIIQKSRNQLDQYAAYYHLLFNHIKHAVCVLDSNGQVENTNMALQQMTGYTSKELEEMHLKSFIVLQMPQEDWVRMVNCEASLINRNGDRTPVMISLEPIMIQHRLCGTFCFIQEYVTANIRPDMDLQQDHSDPGKMLRIYMAKKDMNTKELAAITKLSMATISNLRTGKITKPQRLTAQLISEALDVKIEDIWTTPSRD